MSWGICGTAPSASAAVTATTAALGLRRRLSAANGSAHHTYHGTVHERVRTVASIAAAHAPTSHSRRCATAAHATSTTRTRTTWAAERTPAVAPPAPVASPARFGALRGV